MLVQVNQHFTADPPPPYLQQRRTTTIEMTSRTRKLQLPRSSSSHEIPDVAVYVRDLMTAIDWS
jgi:hypothetical protein